MNTHNHHQHTEGQPHNEAVQVEVEIEDRVEVLVVPVTKDMVLVEVIRTKLELEADVHLFERDNDQPLHHHPHGRKHLRVVGHRCHQVTLEVRYEHLVKHHHFSPSATVFRALQWSVGKHGFNLDPMTAAKANLILPGADQPLPRDDVLSKYVKHGHCTLVVDLTLKDFTNG
ncbi:hypothetical protein I6F14_07625 [Bradyrhizobium sp. IC3069]|uniref:hypothetical protein n=1 Tax=unclassified Bradyrhizobium TaxID=2631580 RepID=UPI001CD4E23A|nr:MULTISPECIES: hypothetical protein [unclassified Bradyrhizobium]MCA1358726.1 hypothetical protein [Bradyrhizobium sp. IC4059]MCA1517901.1 hypothetical protein [Bradyrhizobium sp. IC3069]